MAIRITHSWSLHSPHTIKISRPWLLHSKGVKEVQLSGPSLTWKYPISWWTRTFDLEWECNGNFPSKWKIFSYTDKFRDFLLVLLCAQIAISWAMKLYNSFDRSYDWKIFPIAFFYFYYITTRYISRMGFMKKKGKNLIHTLSIAHSNGTISWEFFMILWTQYVDKRNDRSTRSSLWIIQIQFATFSFWFPMRLVFFSHVFLHVSSTRRLAYLFLWICLLPNVAFDINLRV